jgi:erythronate-4-phosphate dehydrogenase
MVNIATPHIAGYSADGKANGTSVCVREISAFFNLGINPKWYPPEIPKPNSAQEISLDCSTQISEDMLTQLIIHTYNILDDDATLRNSVETFEKQRGSYPIRREFPYYSVKNLNCANDIISKISSLGFKIN